MKISSAPVMALVAAGCVLQAGCEKAPEIIKGSVFVVTKGAGSYKMGLVPVYLLPRAGAAQTLAEVEKAVEQTNAELRKQIKDSQDRIGALQGEKDSSGKQLADLEKDCQGVDAAFSALRGALNLENVSEIPEDLRFVFEAKAKADADRELLRNRISELDIQISAAGEEVSAKTQAVSSSQEIALKSFYEALQGSGDRAVTAKTDGDGQFEIKVPPALADCVLAASGTRLVGDKEDEYFWFYRPEFDSDGKATALLSNDNLVKRLDELKPVVAVP